MSSFFKRLFSSALRRARAAEAAGQLEQAAALYAEADEPGEVVRMHRVRAQQARDPWARIEILRLAASLAGDSREVGLELAHALVDWVETAGVLDRRDKALMEEAAERFVAAGAHEAAGDAWARIGHRNKAAQAYTEAGCIEKLDAVLEREESERDTRQRTATRIDDFHLAESHGLYLEARTALAEALAADPADPRLRELSARFNRRLPTRGCVCLAAADGRGSVALMSRSPLTLGRDEHADLALLAPGISRLHAQLVRAEPTGTLRVEDLGSRHGTFVDGAECAPAQPLGASGELRLGERCVLLYRQLEGGLELVPQLASARNTHYVWGRRWRGSADSVVPPSLSFRLIEDFWHVEPCEGLRVDGEALRQPVLLRLEARLELPDGLVLEVR